MSNEKLGYSIPDLPSVEFESHACLPACPEPALDTCVSFACVAAARPAAVVPACLGDGI
jgi:hypothetical protein